MSARVAPATGLQARLTVWFARRLYGDPMAESTAIFARHPALLRWYGLFNRAVERPRAVPEPLLHLAALKAATVVDCAFCIDIGSEHARRAGLSDEQLLALHDPEPSGLFSADELLVVAYADGLTRTPAVADDAVAAALRERFGDRGLMELTYLIGWENLRARLNVGLGIEAGGFSEGRVCALPASAATASVATEA
ncbi:MAG TPA: carboxymuconolactone decarboxylase family protein [Baekduia sp.]|uniref:carboxymuconolactone decarboxylase family protein n=1 Tax=Baekduia sp. TaxID=2600305 RepID=UPI002D790004|nr:carboxymuconolactone decarboxylase family protein [Baekduia sp.]HET6510038.1 carboxymuconolactone decarboxylase family protein [Baekduia sp.]